MTQYAVIMPTYHEQAMMREIERLAKPLRQDQMDYLMQMLDSWRVAGRLTVTPFLGAFKRALRKVKDNRP